MLALLRRPWWSGPGPAGGRMWGWWPFTPWGDAHTPEHSGVAARVRLHARPSAFCETSRIQASPPPISTQNGLYALRPAQGAAWLILPSEPAGTPMPPACQEPLGRCPAAPAPCELVSRLRALSPRVWCRYDQHYPAPAARPPSVSTSAVDPKRWRSARGVRPACSCPAPCAAHPAQLLGAMAGGLRPSFPSPPWRPRASAARRAAPEAGSPPLPFLPGCPPPPRGPAAPGAMAWWRLASPCPPTDKQPQIGATLRRSNTYRSPRCARRVERLLAKRSINATTGNPCHQWLRFSCIERVV